jgi:hypothetical protein
MFKAAKLCKPDGTSAWVLIVANQPRAPLARRLD